MIIIDICRFILIVGLFIQATVPTYCQDRYESLIDTTKQWTILERIYQPFPDDDILNFRVTYSQRFRGDTTIDSKNFFFLEECRNDSLLANWNRTNYMLREDTLNQQVYVYNSGTEILLYDFSLEVGEVLQVWNDYSVDSVKYEVIANRERKVYYLAGSACDTFKYVEGIGATESLLEPLRWDAVGSTSSRSLLCYSEDNEYLIQNEANCYIYEDLTSLDDNTTQAICQIYPNPSKDYIVIEINFEPEDTAFTLCTLDGRVVVSEHFYSKEIKVLTSKLPAGIYIATLCKSRTCLFQSKVLLNN